MPSPTFLPAGSSRASWLAPALLFTLVWFSGLGTRALWHPDEGRYAEIAREMHASGDYVTPRLSGLRYFEKPPLQYWLTAIAYTAFGVHEWTSRLAPALFGWIAVLAVAYAGTRVATPETGLLAGIALAGSAWPIALGHFVSLDAVLTGCLAVALAGFLVAAGGAVPRHEARVAMAVAWLGVAGAVLAKGLVGLVIPGGALVAYSFATRDFSVWRRLSLLQGIALLVVVTAPWFVLVSARNPEFARFFFVHEHFERFLTTEHNREGAWWYFIPLLLLGLLPWTGIVLARLPALWRDRARTPAGFSWPRFCLAWAAFVFVFFSLSGSKLPSYILPLFPAAALLVARALQGLGARTFERALAAYAAVTVVLAVALAAGYSHLVPRLATERTPAALYDALGSGVKTGFAVIAASAVVAWLLARRHRARTDATSPLQRAGNAGGGSLGPVGNARPVLPAAVVALGMLVGMALAVDSNDALSPSRSARDLVAAVRFDRVVPFDARAPFFQVGTYDQTLPWYLREVTVVVDYRDELGPGIDAEPARAIAGEADWVQRWRALDQAYALLDPDRQARLAREGVPMRVAARNARYVVIARR